MSVPAMVVRLGHSRRRRDGTDASERGLTQVSYDKDNKQAMKELSSVVRQQMTLLEVLLLPSS